MKRRNMLSMLGMGGLASWTVLEGRDQNMTIKDVQMHFRPTFQALLQDNNLVLGDLVTTMGYFNVGDNGEGQYKILSSNTQDELVESNPGLFRMDNGLCAQLINVQAVNYKLFGAKGDGETDDGESVLAAHQFANQNDVPIENLSGVFHIQKVRGIPIETSVSWGNSRFYINEKFNSRNPVFHVKSRFEPVDIPTSGNVGKALIDKLKPGVQIIPELENFENHLIHLYDDQDRIAFRAGNYNKSGRAREELVYVSQKGRILGDVAWSFKSTVTITAYRTESSWLVVDGGTFYLSGDTPLYEESPYSHNGILVTRSRTRIRHQWVGIEEGKQDQSLTPRSGFYYFMKVYDVGLEDVRLNPREKNRPGEGRDVPHGTYGIGGNRVLELSLQGVVAEGTGIHWGVLGTNMMKNVKLTDCRINRFDVHFHLWNLTIRDCEIGYKGITVTGGGQLYIENTTVLQHRFINFRRDYGAKWDGDIYLSHCVLRPPHQMQGVVLLEFQASDFDYGYPIGIARSIEIQDFVVDYSSAPENERDCWLMSLSDYSVTKTGERLFFPDRVQFSDIRVRGRKKGVRIAHIEDANGYQVAQEGVYDGDLFRPNSLWAFQNVDLQKVVPGQKPQEQVHLEASFDDMDQSDIDPDSPHIQLIVQNCPAFSVYLPGIRLQLRASNSIINQVVLQKDNAAEGSTHFEYCDFVPVPFEGKEMSYLLDTVLGTSFLNCVIHLPVKEQEIKRSDLSLISFIELNKRLQYSHINTRLSNDFIRFLKKNNIQLHKDFKAKLMLHSGEQDVI